MNATKWKSLTQFAAFLGREGYCRVEETDKGLFIAWIDRSPETMRKREAIMKKERQDKGDEEREQQQIQEQVERAQRHAKEAGDLEEEDPEARVLQRNEGEKVKLNIGFGSKIADSKSESPNTDSPDEKGEDGSAATPDTAASAAESPAPPAQPAPQQPVKLSMSLGDKKPKNVFAAAAKKNPLSGKKGTVMEQPKKMSEQERIMKAEMEAMERKRMRADSGFPNAKRPKVS